MKGSGAKTHTTSSMFKSIDKYAKIDRLLNIFDDPDYDGELHIIDIIEKNGGKVVEEPESEGEVFIIYDPQGVWNRYVHRKDPDELKGSGEATIAKDYYKWNANHGHYLAGGIKNISYSQFEATKATWKKKSEYKPSEKTLERKKKYIERRNKASRDVSDVVRKIRDEQELLDTKMFGGYIPPHTRYEKRLALLAANNEYAKEYQENEVKIQAAYTKYHKVYGYP